MRRSILTFRNEKIKFPVSVTDSQILLAIMMAAAVAMLPPAHQLGEYSPTVWDRIPPHTEAFPYMSSHPVEESVWYQIRSVFLAHNMAKDFALILIHRHFQLAPNERLVEYNDVATPWEVDTPLLHFTSRIYPKSWAFIDHKLCPYEFGFEADATAPVPSSQIPEAFIKDLGTVLLKYGLTRVFGLGWAQAEKNTMSVGKQVMEFTTGRANITVAMTEENQADAHIEASWKFADKDQGLDGDLKTTMRGCIRCCSFHGGV